jgi:DNA-binding NtrC family response regulator
MSTPRILIIDDEADIRSTLRQVLRDEGYQVDVAADAAAARLARTTTTPDLIFLDIWMPDVDGITLLREWQAQGSLRCPVVMMSGHGTVETAVEATRLGAFDFVEKPLSLAKLLSVVDRALKASLGQRASTHAFARTDLAPVGKSHLMQQLRSKIQQLAPTKSAVLLVGEVGSGRDAYARYLHALSPSSNAPFVSVMCGSLDDTHVSARLRGSEHNGRLEPGLYEQAAEGTLYLNGIEALSLEAQRVLLADIKAGAYTPVNSTQSKPLTARWVCSVLSKTDASGTGHQFVRDITVYLNLITVDVPPLRAYAEDVPDLLRYYVDRLADEYRLPLRRFGVAAQNRLRNYPWPANVRELSNLVHRLLVAGGEAEIGLAELESELTPQGQSHEALVKQDLLALPLREAREAFERAYLQQQLLLCNGKVGLLAKRVGMERTHLYRKLRSLGVDFRQSSDE